MGGICCLSSGLSEEVTDSDFTDILKIEIFSVVPNDPANTSHLRQELQSDLISISSSNE